MSRLRRASLASSMLCMLVLAAGLVYAATASPPTFTSGVLFLGAGSALVLVALVLLCLDLIVVRTRRRR